MSTPWWMATLLLGLACTMQSSDHLLHTHKQTNRLPNQAYLDMWLMLVMQNALQTPAPELEASSSPPWRRSDPAGKGRWRGCDSRPALEMRRKIQIPMRSFFQFADCTMCRPEIRSRSSSSQASCAVVPLQTVGSPSRRRSASRKGPAAGSTHKSNLRLMASWH